MASTINKDNEHAGCSQRVKEVMDEGNDKPADAPGKSLDEGLLLRKGVYPYDYVDGFEKLQETELPPSEALYNTITGEGVSHADYELIRAAITVWDMLLMLEKGSEVDNSLAQRFAKVNNPYVEGFNADKPTNYLMYADADNLYGWDMSSYPPIGGFEWINTDVTNL
ncbi:Hypothetical predicted protein [Mytilus galloprovincialis]|uniref:Uncharacterized protein n=1 Tax=Mytilus galloprovincialis TaxID=29158 RepID=A0A8B6DHH3_MYTGA|nr:Hypothetical predicted protein [Mytilus galloprovincialis]